MSPTIGRDTNASPSKKVWETGVNSDKDNNSVLKVKEVDKFYEEEAHPEAKHVNREGQADNKATKKRKRHAETKNCEFSKKIQRTRTSGGDEEETILMHLRRVDTVIDVSIKSPVKKKTSSKRLSTATRHQQEKSQGGSSASATKRLSQKTRSTRIRENGGTNVMLPPLEDSWRRCSGKEHASVEESCRRRS